MYVHIYIQNNAYEITDAKEETNASETLAWHHWQRDTGCIGHLVEHWTGQQPRQIADTGGVT